ncbi:GTP 3',8-cyclase MoaA [Salipaludibacillus neizhouensis]|uniref:GTP 3',8-cyclase n=1 Tax=Salipaludibacillus neizhouensis TaxID=885475 RepID=A0A3A9KAB1_9BACI|nr:GTP 3',8-cyclase MoaA [Salipaludibacillus neizhouensis]RKL67690.1 GTP 3',8-cyclase MoaA [Salipaludibacillus neizhouensis]
MTQEIIYDSLSRPLKDLRISVTDQCNFRCSYCMPAEIFDNNFPFLKRDQLLSFDEIIRITKMAAQMGVEKIRLTGGEPLLRKDLHLLVEQLNKIDGIKDIALTTNGVYLPKYAKKLKEAGLNRVNISLDAIDDEVFRKMNGRDVPTGPVLKGIESAQAVGFIVKINAVVKKGVNDSQVIPMAKHFKGSGVIVRFIEFMDVGSTNGWNDKHVVPKKDIIKWISEEFPLEPSDPNYFGEVASRYRYKDGTGEIGVISSVSDSFCGTCTRARLSADGKLYTCLFSQRGHGIRSLVRSEENDYVVLKALVDIWEKRSDRYSDERRADGTHPGTKEKIEMSYIGG